MFLEKSLLFSHFRYGWTWLLLHCKTILWLNMFLSCDPSPPWMINIFFTPGNWYVTLWIMDLAWYHIRRNFWRWRVRAVDRDGWKKGSAGWRRQNQRLSQTVDRGSRTAWQHWSDRLGWAAQRLAQTRRSATAHWMEARGLRLTREFWFWIRRGDDRGICYVLVKERPSGRKWNRDFLFR
jgi:hypothetical protein